MEVYMIAIRICLVALTMAGCSNHQEIKTLPRPEPVNIVELPRRTNPDGSTFFYDRTNPAPRQQITISDDIADQIGENFNFDPYQYATTVARGAADNYMAERLTPLTPYAGRFASELFRNPINNAIGRVISPR